VEGIFYAVEFTMEPEVKSNKRAPTGDIPEANITVKKLKAEKKERKPFDRYAISSF
jgi:hypothetical protein